MSVLLSEPIESVISRLWEPSQPRQGDHTGRLWWRCPFHDDRNPSLGIVPNTSCYHCFGCEAHGDAIDFVQGLNRGMSFPEAVRAIEGDHSRPLARTPVSSLPVVAQPRDERPGGWQDFARGVVSRAEGMLWSDRGTEARRYLVGRGLTEDTIRAARLGLWPEDEWFPGIYADRRVFVPAGITIPWFDGPDVTLLNVRRVQGGPKYQAVRGSRRRGLYPSREGILAGRPLVIVEGELDALLLGQELRGLAAVVTLGSAGTRPSALVLNAMLGASPWIVAGDADGAGHKSADDWLSRSDRCVRVVPPIGKDWTEARESGIDLRPWWEATLNRRSARSSRSEELPTRTWSTTAEAPEAIPEAYSIVDGFLIPDPPPCPWRDDVGAWPDDWRAWWGYLANRYSHEGLDCRDAEARAASEDTAEREAAKGGPPPVMDPDPDTARWRDFLDEMIVSGEAAQFLSPEDFCRSRALLTATPLDVVAIRSVASTIIKRNRAGRRAALGLHKEADEKGRWRCQNSFCFSKQRWWMSEYGVVQCMNCRRPHFASLVVAEGEAHEAPFVERDRSNQALKPYPVTKKSNPIGKPTEVAGPIAHASTL
jgi:DNA primase